MGQPYCTALYSSDTVVDHFKSGSLLVIETTVEEVAVDQDIDSLSFEIFRFIESEDFVIPLRVA